MLQIRVGSEQFVETQSQTLLYFESCQIPVSKKTDQIDKIVSVTLIDSSQENVLFVLLINVVSNHQIVFFHETVCLFFDWQVT